MQSEIEELIKRLSAIDWQFSYMNISPLEPPVYFDVNKVRATFKNAISCLRTLQPHDNGELVEALKKCIKGADSQTHPYLLSLLKRAIAALSQPRPFDVLGYLGDGGKLAIDDHVIPKYIHIRENKLVKDDGQEYAWALFLQYVNQWQPYTEPEPTAAELIKNAREAIMNAKEVAML